MTPRDALKTQKICSTDRQEGRITQPAVMRIAACVGIVILHTVFAANEYFAGGLTPTEDLCSRIVENNMMWAVPTFVMTTGVLQLDPGKTLTLEKLYGRYVLRIVMALVACCILFRLIDMVMDGEQMSLAGLGVAFVELVTGRSWGHLWYLYLLIGIYVLLPFYRMIVAKAMDRELYYLCGAYFLFVSLIPMIEGFGVNIAFYISESIIYPLYLFLGYMIYRKILCPGRGLAVLLLILSTAAIVVMDVMKYHMSIDLPGELFGYASPFVIVQTIAVFTLVFHHTGQRQRGGRMLFTIDGCTFGIYLIHMVFIRMLFRYIGWDPYQNMPLLSLPAVILGIFILSLIIVWCLRKIPGVRWVI